MSTTPNSWAPFDWVSERAKCTPLKVFEALRAQVRTDMEIRNSLSAQLPAHKTFSFQENGQWFAVVYGNCKGVKFELTKSGVMVRDIASFNPICNSVLTLSDDGQCRLRIDQTEYDLWQFRKLALHDLFFVNQEIVL